MKSAITAGLALALSSSLFAENAPVPKETKDKVSYSIGTNLGRNLKSSDLDLNPEFLTQGIKDAFAGKTVMTDDQIKETLQSFEQEMEKKMEAKHKTAAEDNKKASEKFLEENKKKEGVKTTNSGIEYKVLTEGKGPKPKASDRVKVHYAGRLINGTEFDSSYKRGEPAEFQLDQVIPGWTEIVQLMPVGSKWEVVIPSNLAYGEQAPPNIGPNQALIFQIELLDIVKDEKKDDAKK